MKRFNSLDAFRGLAATLVLLFHSPFYFHSKPNFLSNGDIFVDFFFILSGFVLSYSYIEHNKENISLKNHITLRLARLYPLHLFLMLMFLLFFISKSLLISILNLNIDSPFIKNDIQGFFSNLFLINAHSLTDKLSWNAPAWSIGAELTTYVLFFSLIPIFIKGGMKKISISIFLFIIGYLFLFFFTEKTLLQTYKMGVIRALAGFFLGATCYFITKEIKYKNSITKDSILEFAAIALVIVMVNDLKVDKLLQISTIILFAITISIYSKTSGILSKALLHRALQWLGKHSYSIYMNHLLIIIIISQLWKLTVGDSFDTQYAIIINVTIITITLIISFFTYNLIEQPFYQKAKEKLL